MKKIVIPLLIGIAFIAFSAGLSGCLQGVNKDKSDLENFVGSWKLNGADLWYELSDLSEITFLNLSFFTTDTDINGEYKIENEKILLTINNGERVISFNYQFSADFQKLTLVDSNGNAASYTKK
jgi:hypothetical protein